MKYDFTQIGFELERTMDGSPTLKIAHAGAEGEKMHHSGGAATETIYIYKSVIDKAYRIKKDAHTCVVGLGLGYIEICWAITQIQLQNDTDQKAKLSSYELNSKLIHNFLDWLSISNEEQSIYDEVCNFLKKSDASLSAAQIKQCLVNAFQNQTVQTDLLKDFSVRRDYNVVCYDAFSRKTNQDLWSYDFLIKFFKEKCHEDCVLTTYACTGELKNALKDSGFLVILRPGFKGKRDSTVALRGIFKTFEPTFRIF